MMKHVGFDGRLVIVGFGSIGQGVLPLILRHLALPATAITIVTAESRGEEVAREYGVKFLKHSLTRTNYVEILDPMLGEGDFLLNVSVDVSSLALLELCRAKGALYLDTCTEPWAGGYTDPSVPPPLRSNYAFRESVLKMRAAGDGPTAVVTHGANPGLVSHFVKQAMLDVARDTGLQTALPKGRQAWAELAHKLSIKVIHVAERDTQRSSHPKKPGEFVNTWSIEGFFGEGCQPAELGWGSHEKGLPVDGRRHDFGCGSGIWLTRPGASVRVRSWTPGEGPYHGFLITHAEALSIADYLTVGEGGRVEYRPTVHYAYHPCDDAVLSVHEAAGKNWQLQDERRLMMEEITPGGIDELGVLLAGHARGAYWFGSNLTVDEARRLCPHNNATSLQVTASVLAGMIWAIENPRRGVVEPDEIDHARILEIARPYLGRLVGAYTDWTPLIGREMLFAEELDRSDPWQFKNVRVV